MASHQTPALIKTFMIALHQEVFDTFQTCAFDISQYEELKKIYSSCDTYNDPLPHENCVTMVMHLENIWNGERIVQISRTLFRKILRVGPRATREWLLEGLERECWYLLRLKKSFDSWKEAHREATSDDFEYIDWASQNYGVKALHQCAFVRALIVATMPVGFITSVRQGIATNSTIDRRGFASQEEILLENPHYSAEALRLAQMWSYSLYFSQEARNFTNLQLDVAQILPDLVERDLASRRENNNADETVDTAIKERNEASGDKSQDAFIIKPEDQGIEGTVGPEVSPDKADVVRHTVDDLQRVKQNPDLQEYISPDEPLATAERDHPTTGVYRDQTGWLAETAFQMKIINWARASTQAGTTARPSQFANDIEKSPRKAKVKTRGVPDNSRQANTNDQPLEAAEPMGAKIWKFTSQRQYDLWRKVFPLPGEPDRAKELTWKGFVKVMSGAPLSFTDISCSKGNTYTFSRPPMEGMPQMSFTVHKPHANMDCQKEFVWDLRSRFAQRWGWLAEHFVLEKS